MHGAVFVEYFVFEYRHYVTTNFYMQLAMYHIGVSDLLLLHMTSPAGHLVQPSLAPP